MHWSWLTVNVVEAAPACSTEVTSTVVLVGAQEEPELLHSTVFSAKPTNVVAESATVGEAESTAVEDVVGSGLT